MEHRKLSISQYVEKSLVDVEGKTLFDLRGHSDKSIQEFLKCWNMHDELVGALKTVIWDSENVDQGPVNDSAVVIYDTTLEKIKSLLAEAEKE